MRNWLSNLFARWSHVLRIEHDGDLCHDRYHFDLPVVNHKVPFSVVLPHGYVPLSGLSCKHKLSAVLEHLSYRLEV